MMSTLKYIVALVIGTKFWSEIFMIAMPFSFLMWLRSTIPMDRFVSILYRSWDSALKHICGAQKIMKEAWVRFAICDWDFVWVQKNITLNVNDRMIKVNNGGKRGSIFLRQLFIYLHVWPSFPKKNIPNKYKIFSQRGTNFLLKLKTRTSKRKLLKSFVFLMFFMPKKLTVLFNSHL